MPLRPQDVVDCYRLVLAREPRSDAEAAQALTDHASDWDLALALLDSPEYRGFRCRLRRRSTSVTPQLVDIGYRVLLRRDPESDAATARRIRRHRSLGSFVDELVSSVEHAKRFERLAPMRSEALNRGPKLVFLHIPKTAGVSFDSLLNDVYGQGVSLSRLPDFDVDAWAGARVIGGHFHRDHFDGMTVPRLFISVVRDPIDRAISLFNYQRVHQFGPGSDAPRRGFDVDDLERTVRESEFRNDYVGNRQCRFLSGFTDFVSTRTVLERDAYIVGHLDAIDAMVDLLADRLGWGQHRLPRWNAATSDSYADAFRDDQHLVDVLRRENVDDQQLVDFVRSHGVFEHVPAGFDYSAFAP